MYADQGCGLPVTVPPPDRQPGPRHKDALPFSSNCTLIRERQSRIPFHGSRAAAGAFTGTGEPVMTTAAAAGCGEGIASGAAVLRRFWEATMSCRCLELRVDWRKLQEIGGRAFIPSWSFAQQIKIPDEN